jgi:hypothetical protein
VMMVSARTNLDSLGAERRPPINVKHKVISIPSQQNIHLTRVNPHKIGTTRCIMSPHPSTISMSNSSPKDLAICAATCAVCMYKCQQFDTRNL